MVIFADKDEHNCLRTNPEASLIVWFLDYPFFLRLNFKVCPILGSFVDNHREK